MSIPVRLSGPRFDPDHFAWRKLPPKPVEVVPAGWGTDIADLQSYDREKAAQIPLLTDACECPPKPVPRPTPPNPLPPPPIPNPADNPEIRIGVLVEVASTTLKAKEGGTLTLVEGEKTREVAAIAPGEAWKFQTTPKGIAVYNPQGELQGTYNGKLRLTGKDESPLAANNAWYRGSFDIEPDPYNQERLNVVNRLPLESYLRGVVPSEMPASWHPEALKAQSIAARTYAVANWGRRHDRGIDLYATVSDQVYKGIAGEMATADAAIAATKGNIVRYEGKPINALFHANAGGHTDNIKPIWGFDLPYIRGVKDFDQESPKYKWQTTLTAEQVRCVVKQLCKPDVGTILSLKPVEMSPYGRVAQIKVTGTKGSVILAGNLFRLTAGLNSTRFTIKTVQKKPTMLPASFTLTGQGWGHGLGMSQWGAKKLAETGKTYSEILQHYYTGVTVE